jgi:hypothetical protein
MKQLISILLILASSQLFAQPEAKIVGPREAPAGELVVLSSTGSKGDNLVWVRPENIQTVQAGCSILDSQIFFSTTKLGKYEFMLIAADKEARVSFVRHVVEIKTQVGQPAPDDPKPDPKPDQPTPGKWNALQEKSKATADTLNDNATRQRLKSAIASAILGMQSKCDAGECPSLVEAKTQILATIEAVLIGRVGQSALVDWTQWRRGNQAELDRLGIAGIQDYLAALKAIASGL